MNSPARPIDRLPPTHPFRVSPKPLVVAHRGASARAPENTLAAFRLALDAGADAVETDLWQTADGHFVCHHDATLARMTGDARRVDAVALAELRRLRVAGGERVPTLDELLELVPPEVILVLELKDPRFVQPELGRRLAERLGDRLAAFTAVAVSFHLPWLLALRNAAPGFPVGHITLRNPVPTQPTELLGPAWPLVFLNPFYTRLAHRRGRLVGVLDPWPEPRLGWYRARGVDAVLANDPGAVIERLRRLREG
jgi:glycerophosphoryl diester phosphodiesterase